MTVIRGVQLQEAYTMTDVWCDQKLIVDLTGVPRADRRRLIMLSSAGWLPHFPFPSWAFLSL